MACRISTLEKVAQGFASLACFCFIALLVGLIAFPVHSELSDTRRGRPDLTNVPSVTTMDQARDALAKFGDVEARYYPDGAWRVWMSGSRVEVEKGIIDSLWNGDRYLADRQCLQIVSLADGSAPKLSQLAFLENIEYGGSPDCPSMVSGERDRLDHTPRNRTNEYLRRTSPRTDELTDHARMVTDALDPERVAYQVVDPSKTTLPLAERFTAPFGWSTVTLTPTAVDLLPPPPPFTTSADWDTDRPNYLPPKPKSPIGWRVIAVEGERPQVCLIWMTGTVGVQPSCK